MGSAASQRKIARFGLFQVDLEERVLGKKGVPVKLQDKPFQILVLLLEHAGEVVTREELKAKLWPADTFVEFDDGLNTAIKKLRIALDDPSDNPIFIETIPRRGYRFLAPVKQEPDSPPAAGDGIASSQPYIPVVPVVEAVPSAPVRRKHTLWIAVPVGAAVLLVSALIVWTQGKTAHKPIQSLIILPMENLSGDPAQEFFAEGITDQLTTDLAKLGQARVISRTSAMRYKGAHKRASEIGRELHVDGIIEGTVERAGDQVRIRTQLIYAPDDHHLWAESYDRDLKDVLKLESEVAQDIAGKISGKLIPSAEPIIVSHPRSVDPKAYEKYLQAHHYWNERTAESLAKAIERFNEAIALDQNYAQAYAGLADCYIVLPFVSNVPYANTYPKAQQAAAKALSLDDSLAEAHLAEADVRLYLDWDFPGAEREFKRTLELNPNYAQAHQWYSEFLSLMGRHSEAIAEITNAEELDPLSMIIYHQAGQTFQAARQYDEALHQYQRALQIRPDFGPTYSAMGDAYRRQGRFSDGFAATRRGVNYWDPSGSTARDLDHLAHTYTASGERAFWLASIEFEKVHPISRPAVQFAWCYAEIGKKKQALFWLQKAFEARDPEVLHLRNDPELDSLHSNQKFQAIVKAIGLP